MNQLRSFFFRWKNGELKQIFDDFKWLLRYTYRFKGRIVLCTLLNIIQTSFGLVSSIAGKYTLDIITGYDRSRLWQVIVIMLGSSAVSLALSSISGRISLKTQIIVTNSMEEDIFNSVMDADWLSFSRYQTGDILSRFRGDIPSSAQYAINWLPNLIGSVYGFVASFAVITHYDPFMGLIALASVPFTFLIGRAAIYRTREYALRQKKIGSVLSSFENEVFHNFDTIKSMNLGRDYTEKLGSIKQDSYKLSMESNLFSIKISAIASAFRNLFYFLAFGYCIYRLFTGDITYGTMTLFMRQRSSITSSLSSVASSFSSIITTSVSSNRVRELAELPKEPYTADLPNGEVIEKAAIIMKNVSFSYKGDCAESDGKEEIRHSDFTARPGEIVAITGPSGEGKTTLFRLLLALIRPGDGTVMVEADYGVSIPAGASTRRLISYVPQGNSIIAGTIEENLRMVKKDATESEMITALKDACAWSFVKELPEQLNYKLAERGKGLSEGQAQRIAIARALLRDAPILLLDEFTSALDTETEKSILENITRSRRNRTIVISVHRPSVLAICNRVYRIYDGKITEISIKENTSGTDE